MIEKAENNLYLLSQTGSSDRKHAMFHDALKDAINIIDSSYRSLVNIPSELNYEFAAQVGDLPPYLQLNNLQPEVAKAFVADVLMT